MVELEIDVEVNVLVELEVEELEELVCLDVVETRFTRNSVLSVVRSWTQLDPILPEHTIPFAWILILKS